MRKNNINNIVFVQNEISKGYSDQSPFNAIVIEGAIQEVPTDIISQLDNRGRLATIIQDGNVCWPNYSKRMETQLLIEYCLIALFQS